jgi:hypothetical protein
MSTKAPMQYKRTKGLVDLAPRVHSPVLRGSGNGGTDNSRNNPEALTARYIMLR